MELFLYFLLSYHNWFFSCQINISKLKKLLYIPIIWNLTIFSTLIYILVDNSHLNNENNESISSNFRTNITIESHNLDSFNANKLFLKDLNSSLDLNNDNINKNFRNNTSNYTENLNKAFNASLIIWMYIKLILSSTMVIVSLILLVKSTNIENKEKLFFEYLHNKNVFIRNEMYNFDHWIKFKYLLSIPGYIFWILSIVKIFWAFVILNVMYFTTTDENAGYPKFLYKIILVDSLYYLISNFPMLIATLVFSFNMLFSILITIFCPGSMKTLSKISDLLLCKCKNKKRIYLSQRKSLNNNEND